jgi:ATP-dependent Clp protease adaptor protein ClpS
MPCHDRDMAGTVAPEHTEQGVEPAVSAVPDPDRPWITIVWNDPINLMSYVTHVFMKVFGYSRDKAHKLMLDVHERGRAVVSTGTRERMELDVATLHGYGLWATLEQQT